MLFQPFFSSAVLSIFTSLCHRSAELFHLVCWDVFFAHLFVYFLPCCLSPSLRRLLLRLVEQDTGSSGQTVLSLRRLHQPSSELLQLSYGLYRLPSRKLSWDLKNQRFGLKRRNVWGSRDSQLIACRLHQITQLEIFSEFSTRSQHGKMDKTVLPGICPSWIPHMVTPLFFTALWQPGPCLAGAESQVLGAV